MNIKYMRSNLYFIVCIFALALFRQRNYTLVEVVKELSVRRKGCVVLLYVRYFNC